MFTYPRSILVLVALLFSCAATAAVAAQTFTVTASNFTFTPQTLTINAGDSVTFTNGGGGHNVVADDGSFTSGAVSTSAWSVTHTFNTAGTFRYYCQAHGGPGGIGMSGTITVNDVAPPPPPPSIKLGANLTGEWYNSAQSGHGFLFEFTNVPDSAVPSQNDLVVYWFVYTPDGSGQNWIFALGPYDTTKSTVTLPATLFEGPKFPFPLSNYDPNAFQGQAWGTLTFSFSDCNNGTASWNSTISGYGSGSMPITRITSIPGAVCQ